MCHRDPVEVKKLRIEVDRLRRELDSRNTYISTLEQRVNRLQEEEESSRQIIAARDKTILEYQDNVEEIADDLAKIRLRELEEDLDSAQAKVIKQRRLLDRLLDYEHPSEGVVFEMLYNDTVDGRRLLTDMGRLPA